jgi:hypothetical protein
MKTKSKFATRNFADDRLLLDEMEEAGDAEITIHPPSATAGHWGWATDPRAGRPDRPRSRLMMGKLLMQDLG